jgi:acyl-CoA thioesterase I
VTEILPVYHSEFMKEKQQLPAWAWLSLAFLMCGTAVLSLRSTVAAAAAPKTVVFFGDSLAAGYGIDVAQAFPALVQEKIAARGWNFTVVNAGKSGETTAGGLRRLEWLLRGRVDVLVLELGGNDGLRGIPVEVTGRNLQAIIDRTREKNPAAKVVVAGMQVPPNLGEPYATEFRRLFVGLAKKNRCPLIPFLLEGVGGVRELNLPDGIHPTAEGHRIIAENVWKVLQPVLRSLL